MPKRAFITGATGFVGSNLCRSLVDQGVELRCLVRPGNKAENLAGVEFERVDGSLDDEESLADALRNVDEVYHLAALVSFRRADRQAMQAVNVDGTARLARLARLAGVGRLLYMSSIAAVGYAEDRQPIDENAPYNFGRQRISYCDTKRGGELALLEEVKQGLDAVIVNPSSMFGPGDRRKAEGSLLQDVARDKIPFCPSGGLNVASVTDVVDGTLAAMARGRTGERYILGGENLTGRELFSKIYGVLGRKPPRFTLPGPIMNGAAMLLTAVDAIKPLDSAVTGAVARMARLHLWYRSDKAMRELGYRINPIEPILRQTFETMAEMGLINRSQL